MFHLIVTEVQGDLTFLEDYPYWRLIIYEVCTHNYFEVAVAIVISLNILVMAIEFYQMPYELLFALKILGYVFTFLLILEAIAKLVAFGISRYFSDRWNQFDFAVVILSIVAIYLEEAESTTFPVNPTIIRVARIVRIARVFKLFKTAEGIRRLLDTVVRALPQVGNLTLFFLLLFFIYASLGVELFGKFTCVYGQCEGLSRHANYDNFGMALLTLFRIFTGDDWNGILKDMLRVADDPEECALLLQTSGNSTHTSEFECLLAGAIAPFYFVSFVLLSQFVLINVVVAVLMNELEVWFFLFSTFFSSTFIFEQNKTKKKNSGFFHEGLITKLLLSQTHLKLLKILRTIDPGVCTNYE